MPKRFSDINRGGELKLALDNLNKYRAEALTRTSPRITGTGVPKNRLRSIVSVAPFYMAPGAAAALKKVQVSQLKGVDTAGENFGKGAVSPYQGEAKASNTPKPQGFSPARVRIFEPESEDSVGKYEKSKFTGLYYVKRPGKGFNMPIGKAAADDTYEGVTTAISNALASEVNAKAYRRISFQEELIPGDM